ncbi:SIR2 family protein [Neoroseomonas oryzicola]|uniref:SIR2 family protein n=1 Tax=Neoroseomonas oryzicola TaxID=535904 RepID=UPI0030BA0E74
MHAPSSLPNFDRLVRRVFRDLDSAIGLHLEALANPEAASNSSLPPLSDAQTAMLRRIIDQEYDVALGMLERRVDRDQEKASRVRQAVCSILREARRHAPIHASLVKLSNRGATHTIATTNFDLLLERAARALRVPLQRYALQDIPRPSLRPDFGGVLHLHGALDLQGIRDTDLVLTDRDFGEHYMRRRAIPDLIYDAARIFHIVLVGYSLADPPMRYLLNAVAADGQRFGDLKERFAFVGLKPPFDPVVLATWKERGITPLPYDVAKGHAALANVLESWAAISPFGKQTDPYRRIRRILQFPRSAASEASASLFGHLFRRSSDAAQIRIAAISREMLADPAWLDGMIEIVREGGARADREAHVTQLCHASLVGRFTDASMLQWVAQLPVERRTERTAIFEALRWNLDKTVPQPWLEAWRLISDALAARAGNTHREHEDYHLGQRVKQGVRSAELVADIARWVAPRLRIGWRDDELWRGKRLPGNPKSVDDLLSRWVTSGEALLDRSLSLRDVTEIPFLLSLCDALDAEVSRALHLGQEVGWTVDRGFIWLGGLDRVQLRSSNEDSDSADRYHKGIAPAVHLLMRVVERLVDLDPAAAVPVLSRWETRDDPVRMRMFAAAAVEPRLVDPDHVGRFLRSRTPDQTWDLSRFPEIAALRALRFGELSRADQTSICGVLILGPPRARLRRRGLSTSERRRLKIGAAIRELSRIEATGASLPPKAAAWLQREHLAFPEFMSTSVDAGFRTSFSSGWVPPNRDSTLDAVDDEELPGAVDERLRHGTGRWEGPERAVWDWLDVRDNATRLVRALISEASRVRYLGHAWEAVGRRHLPAQRDPADSDDQTDHYSDARALLDAISRLPDETLREAASGLCTWLENWARRLRGDAGLTTAIRRVWPHAVAGSGHSSDATDYEDEAGAEAKRIAHDSLNAPIGRLTGAFLLACPTIATQQDGTRTRPFEVDPGLRAILDLVAETQGRPGTIARYRCVADLPYLMSADEDWTELTLISRLESGAESDSLWHALAHSPIAQNVMARLALAMTRRAALGGLEMEARRSLVARVCIAVLGDFWKDRVVESLLPEVEQMLRTVPDDLRAYAAGAAESFVKDVTGLRSGGTAFSPEEVFDRAVEPFVRLVWPREKAVVTPAVSEAFASLPAVCGRRFAKVVLLVRHALVPFEAWSMSDWGIFNLTTRAVEPNVILGADEAMAAVDLLDLTIGTSPDARVPLGLDTVLDHIAAQNSAVRLDPRYSRLSALSRR